MSGRTSARGGDSGPTPMDLDDDDDHHHLNGRGLVGGGYGGGGSGGGYGGVDEHVDLVSTSAAVVTAAAGGNDDDDGDDEDDDGDDGDGGDDGNGGGGGGGDRPMLTAEEAEWEASARAIAEKIQAEARRVADKVQRQQEGKESAMLGGEHRDDSFLTVDDIRSLLDVQIRDNAPTTAPPRYTSRYNRGGAGMAAAAVSDPAVALKLGEWFLGRARSIPLRLSYEERKHLRLVQAVMRGNEYTQKVDGKRHKTAARRSQAKMKCVQAVLMGMVTALSPDAGAKLVQDRDFSRYRTAIQTLFEIGRRYKIMNPDRMRGEYGKLLYLLQDEIIFLSFSFLINFFGWGGLV